MHSKLILISIAAALTGCTVGPNYKRPAVPAVPQFRAGESKPTATSLGETKWFDLFKDNPLRDLIREALRANYDIGIATQRVLQAEGQLMATRSFFFPQLNAPGTLYRNGLSSPIQSQGAGGYGATWEIDLLGKLRRATEAARADLLASDDNRKAVFQALVAQ